MCVCVCVLVAQLCLILCDPMDCSLPGSSVHEFSRQEYWSVLSFSSPGHLPDQGTEPGSVQADSLLSEPPGKPITELPKFTSNNVPLKITF